MQPTKTPTTEQEYKGLFTNLAATALKQKWGVRSFIQRGKTISPFATPRDVEVQFSLLQDDQVCALVTKELMYDFFLDSIAGYSKRTWNKYLACTVYCLSLSNPKEGVEFKQMCANMSIQCKRRGVHKKTASLKQRVLKENDFARLLSIANSSPRLNEIRIASFILASCYTGLRPSEFANAIFEDGSLFVLNGKNTNGRATGDIRNVPVSTRQWRIFLDSLNVEVSDEFLKMLEDEESTRIQYVEQALNHASIIIGSAAPFPINADSESRKVKLASFFKSCSRNRFKDWDPSPCPYTGRHVFSANWKNVLSKEALASLLGHASSDTAGKHYARRVQGQAEFRSEYINKTPASPRDQQSSKESS